MPIAVIYGSAVMLFIGAALHLPYGYYTLLRLVACVVFGLAAYIALERKHRLLPWCYGLLALVFNPIIKIHLPKDTWAIVDIVAGVFLIMTAKALKQKTT